MTARHRIRRTAVALCATLGVAGGLLALTVVPAAAVVGYPPSVPNAVFGASGSGDGQFSDPAGVAVDDSTGDVYVVDSGNDRVQKFGAEGKYLAQFGGAETPAGAFSGPASIAVDNGAGADKGDVYVTDVGHGVIDVFNTAGKYVSQIVGAPTSFAGTLLGVAVDGSGDIWVYESAGNVDEFSEAGALVKQFNTGRGAGAGFALDSAGHVYVLFGSGSFGKYTPAGTQLAEWGYGVAVAVDETTNDVFLATYSGIEEFGPFGEPYGSPLQSFAVGGTSEMPGIAVDDATGIVYASQKQADSVAIFKPGLLYPDVSTGVASGVQRNVAKLEGTVDPDGQEVTACTFEYGITTAYGQTAACSPAPGSGSSAVAVSAQLSGLAPATTYHYRVLATNANGANAGTDEYFTTESAVPGLQTEAADVEEATAATIGAMLRGSLEPAGADTHYYFEYGETEAYGSVSPALPGTDAGSASKTVAAGTQIVGLKPETTYHYRIVAANSFGTEAGADATFTTPGVVPRLQSEAATGVELSGSTIFATLHGSLEPAGADTHYYFEYGETEAYGSVGPALPGGDAGSAFKLEDLQLRVSGLKPYVIYHFRLVASNSFGTTRGADETFSTTGLIPAPVVEGRAASGVSQFTATLNGALQTGEALVGYRFEYGTTTAYGQVAPVPDGYTPISSQTVSVSQPVNGLQAGTTYHYRLVASSPGGTEVAGPDETFTTSAVPVPAVLTGGASGVGVGAATLSGTVDPQGWDTSYYFQYGTSAAYGSSWPTVEVEMGALEGAQPVVVNVPNLLPGTTYHYRLVASNGGGTTYGPDMTFTTGEYPAAIIQEPSTLRTLLVPTSENTKTTPKKTKKKTKKTKKHKTTKKGKAHHSTKGAQGRGRQSQDRSQKR